MSNCNNTTNLLSIEDENITISENAIETMKVNGVETKIIHAKLTYNPPQSCPCCGVINEKHDIIKHGFKQCNIILPQVSSMDALLCLKKQRFYCKHCEATFLAQTSIVDYNRSISKNTFFSVLLELKEKQSVYDISQRYNISHTTIHKWVHSIKDSFIINYHHLPEHLSFDEFKSVKEVKGKMSFIYADSITGKVIDILTHRHINYLKSYFYQYPRAVRAKVKTVCIDMYKGYIDLIRQCFPNAIIITDRFHVVQLINRSFNKVRIHCMNQSKDNYRLLKRYWKLLLKNYEKLDQIYYRKYYGFYYKMTEAQVIHELLRLDEELEQSYHLMQRLRMAIRHRDITNFNRLIEKDYSQYPQCIMTTIKTLRYHKDSINNALTHEFSNGKLEGTNNLIKVIKRIAFGYRNFDNFRSRILLICNTMVPIDKRLPQI